MVFRRVEERLGHTVVFPNDQTCCGQMHRNAGYEPEGERLAKRFVGIFSKVKADAIVTPSASCAATLREELPKLAGYDPSKPAARLCSTIFEFSQFLIDVLDVEDVGAYYPHRVAYHPTCHSLRALGITDQPRRLLGAVNGIRMCELADADVCCGFGGIFAMKNPDVSAAMGTDKVSALISSGAEVCAAVDNSCLLHIEGMLRRQRTGLRVAHVADILASTGARVL